MASMAVMSVAGLAEEMARDQMLLASDVTEAVRFVCPVRLVCSVPGIIVASSGPGLDALTGADRQDRLATPAVRRSCRYGQTRAARLASRSSWLPRRQTFEMDSV